MTKIRCDPKKKLVGGGQEIGFARPPVEEIGRCGESFGPPTGRHGSVNKNSTDAIVESTKNVLSLSILLGSIRASEAEESAMGCEKRAICKVVKLFAIVGLKSENGA